jgi:hypothetical protein
LPATFNSFWSARVNTAKTHCQGKGLLQGNRHVVHVVAAEFTFIFGLAPNEGALDFPYLFPFTFTASTVAVSGTIARTTSL